MPIKPAALNTPIRVYLYRRRMYKKAINDRKPHLGSDHPMILMYKLKMRQNEEMIAIRILTTLGMGWVRQTKLFWRIFG